MTLTIADDHIETERLILRHIAPADLPFYARIHADPDVARYLSHGNPRTGEESRSWLEQTLQSYQALGLGQLAVWLKSDGTLLGRCGLSYMEVDTAPSSDGTKLGFYFPSRAPDGVSASVESELGYTFDPAVWGRGYAREAVAAVYDYAMKHRPKERIVSLIHPDNVRSKRLADRFGVTLVDRVSLWARSFDRYAWPEGATDEPI